MTTPNNTLSYSQNAPTQIQVDSLGIGISKDTLQNLNMSPSEHLIVGENSLNSGQVKSYGLIAGKSGIALSTSVKAFNDSNMFDLFVDGDVKISGNLTVNNVINTNTNTNYWVMASDNTSENIYYTGNINIANNVNSQDNKYAINVARLGNYDIDKTHLSIQNLQNSQYRMGILGLSSNSPMVLNTTSNTKLEIHMGRDQDYFKKVYNNSNYSSIYYNEVTGSNAQQLINTISDVPNYGLFSNIEYAPHFQLDEIGNVGIHTSANIPLNYNIRIDGTSLSNIINPASLHVNGPLFAEDIIMRDRDTDLTQHLDDIYVRKMGITLEASQIIPGHFALGDYSFDCNLNVGKNLVNQFLKVTGSNDTNYFVGSNVLINDSQFLNDIHGNRDLYIDDVRFSGQLYNKIFNADSNQYEWALVNFQVQTSNMLSNIYPIGDGIAVPGRIGGGINPTNPITAFSYDNSIDSQLTIAKPNSDIWELKLLDKSENGNRAYRKVAYIGHPKKSNDFLVNNIDLDASLVFATPMQNDDQFTGTNSRINQNFYFFPGADFKSTAEPILNNKPPTLGIFADNTDVQTRQYYSPGRVGINTYSPAAELDVNGSIKFNNELIYNNYKIGLWFNDYADNNSLNGIKYINDTAPYVGINIPPDNIHALLIDGKLKVNNGIFIDVNNDTRKLGNWYDNANALTVTNFNSPDIRPGGIFTWGNVGIGTKYPSADLELINNYTSETSIKLNTALGVNTTSLIFAGLNQPWSIRNNNFSKRLEVGYGSNINNNNSNERALWVTHNSPLNRHQIVIGCNVNYVPEMASWGNVGGIKYPTLTVGGDMYVHGDVAIDGCYYAKGRIVFNGDSNQDLSNSNINPDDVYIGGNKIKIESLNDEIQLIPNDNNRKSIIIGDPNAFAIIPNNSRNNATLVVVQNKQDNPGQPADIIGSFITKNQNGYVRISTPEDTIKFGITKQFGAKSFGFWDSTDSPYIIFKQQSSSTERFIGFNNNNPSALFHLYTNNNGSNLFRITQQFPTNDTTNLNSPQLDIEKKFSSPANSVKWSIQGPIPSNTNQSVYRQKIRFMYGAGENYLSSNEAFTITNNGCIGLNNPEPKYAIDVLSTTSNVGGIRFLNYDDSGSAQIILQSRANSNENTSYGTTRHTDYQINVLDDEFTIKSKNESFARIIEHVNSNGQIGLCGYANSNYNVNITGKINIKSGGIYIDDYPLFNTSNFENGYTISSKNIFLNPQVQNGGGIIINNTKETSNLFHLFSGCNANMMVLDSDYNDVQMHYKCLNGNTTLKNIYRTGASNNTFYWEFTSNQSPFSANYYISGTHSNYLPVANFTKSLRNDAAASNNFDMNINGSIYVNGFKPSIYLNSSNILGTSNNDMYLYTTGNIGIGTNRPLYNTHVYANNKPLVVENIGTADIVRFINNSNQLITLNNRGNIGIGTTNPRAKLDIIGESLISNGTNILPAYSFSASSNTGIYSPIANNISLASSAKERVRIDENGNIGIGTFTSLSNLVTISSNINYTLLHVSQKGTGNILELSNRNNVRSTVINSVGNVGIGTTNPLHSLHLTGNLGINGNIIPITTNTCDIGIRDNGLKNIFIAGTSFTPTRITKTLDDYILFADQTNNDIVHNIEVNNIRFNNNNKLYETRILFNDNSNLLFDYELKYKSDGSVINYNPLLIKQSTNTISIGNSNNDASIHLTTNTSIPSLIIDQNTNNDILRLNNTNGNLITILSNGNVGIGSTLATSPLDININNNTDGLKITQNSGGNIAKFVATNTGRNIVFNYQGNVGIGTSAPIQQLHVEGDILVNGHATITSNVYLGANLEVYGNTHTQGNVITDSDKNIKSDIIKIDNALEKINKLSGYTFMLNKLNIRSTGLIAQEVKEVLPEVVTIDSSGTHGVAYGNMMGLIIEGIKELNYRLDKLENI